MIGSNILLPQADVLQGLRFAELILAIVNNPSDVKAALSELAGQHQSLNDARAEIAKDQASVADERDALEKSREAIAAERAKADREIAKAESLSKRADERRESAAAVKVEIAARVADLAKQTEEWRTRSRRESEENEHRSAVLAQELAGVRAQRSALDAAIVRAEGAEAAYENKLAALKKAVGA